MQVIVLRSIMKTVPSEIAKIYSDICSQPSDEDTVKAYVEAHQWISANQPTHHEIRQATAQRPDAQMAIDSARNSQVRSQGFRRNSEQGIDTVYQNTALFAGSGLIVMGDLSGELIGASYQLDADGADAVEEKYPNYFSAAIRKVSQAALLGCLGKAGQELIDQVAYINDLLIESQLAEPGSRTHLGFDVSTAGFTAGTTGMLPSADFDLDGFGAEDGVKRGELDEIGSIDTGAGWLDYLASNGATMAIEAIALGQTEVVRDFHSTHPSRKELQELNLH